MGISPYLRDLRGRIGTDLLLLPSVTALVRDEQTRILLVRCGAHWTLPGGFVDPGEAPVEALIREVLEESGVIVRAERVLGIFGGPDGFRRTYANGDQVECVDILMLCTVVTGDLLPQDDEMEEAAYFAQVDVPEWIYPVPLSALQAAITGGETLWRRVAP